MVDCPCPVCERSARWLDAASQDAHVDYYRCDGCGHVWNVPKGQPDAPRKTVVQGRPYSAVSHVGSR